MPSWTIEQRTASQIPESLLDHFDRTQPVTQVYRGEHGAKSLVELVYTEQWGPAELRETSVELREIASRGGGVFVAVDGGAEPLGFAAVDPSELGQDAEYRQLTALHVTAPARRRGIGRALFAASAAFARSVGAQRLYISSQSSAETVAFYRSVGCLDAHWLYNAQIAAEPCDYQLEYVLEGERLVPGPAV